MITNIFVIFLRFLGFRGLAVIAGRLFLLLVDAEAGHLLCKGLRKEGRKKERVSALLNSFAVSVGKVLATLLFMSPFLRNHPHDMWIWLDYMLILLKTCHNITMTFHSIPLCS